MNLRTLKARADHRTHRLARLFAFYADAGEDHYFHDDEGQVHDVTCRFCDGTGGDPWNDGITHCPECDGEGYAWWR